MDKRLIGKLGEKLVCKWYEDRKYTLLDVNYRTRFGEIDIIARNKTHLVFIEVKPARTGILQRPGNLWTTENNSV